MEDAESEITVCAHYQQRAKTGRAGLVFAVGCLMFLDWRGALADPSASASNSAGSAYAVISTSSTSDVDIQSGDFADHDQATIEHLRQAHPLLFWLRDGKETHFVIDQDYVARAEAIITSANASRSSTVQIDADEWAVRGPIMGADAQLRSLESRRLQLSHGKEGDAERLADLDMEEKQVKMQEHTLRLQLASLQPKLAERKRDLPLIEAEVSRNLRALMHGAVQQGLAKTPTSSD